MNIIKPSTPKGFRDYLPQDALRRQFVVDKIKTVFQKFGFDPLETPTLEYEETLSGKYGEEEKLIYKFKTPGGDKVALRYDQTVPLARVIAQYGPRGEQKLPIPFKRYQIQSAYRGDNPQKGRYREFIQCDADIIGISNPIVDAEILGLVYELYYALNLKVIIKVNDRSLLASIEPKYLSAIDKLKKIGEEDVLKELEARGQSKDKAIETFEFVKGLKPTQSLGETLRIFGEMGYPQASVEFDPTLIRGLDYYTGIIMEAVLVSNPNGSSVGGGGRYDKMIGNFTGVDIPANGFSIGLDRTIEAMEEVGVLNTPQTNTKVLVTIFSERFIKNSLKVAATLRSSNIDTEIWLDPAVDLDKQLKYADQKGIPFAIIIGPDEAQQEKVVLKDLKNRTQQTLSLDELLAKLGQ